MIAALTKFQDLTVLGPDTSIARTLAQSYGVILGSKANEIEGAAAENLGSYSCVALY